MAESSVQLESKTIHFPNGHEARLFTPPSGTAASVIVQALELPTPKTLFLILGGASDLDEALQPRLLQLFSRGLARVAADTGAVIMDGGTASGVMSITGQGVAERRRKSTLLGVAPAGKVTYPGSSASAEDVVALEQNHTHFVLVDSQEWGGETEALFEIADSLAGPQTAVMAILVNGGPVSRDEVLRSVRRGWPLVVISGTGRLADEIAQSKNQHIDTIKDPVLAEIIADGDITLFPLQGKVQDFHYLLYQMTLDPNLKLAWERHRLYDANASSTQTNFKRLQMAILSLGVLVTLLALAKTYFFPPLPETPKETGTAIAIDLLGYVIIIIPITTAMLLALASRFKWGQKWVLLRAAAEAVKREFFRYWTGTGIYSASQTTETSRQRRLAQELENIAQKLQQTEVNLPALLPSGKGSVFPLPPVELQTSIKDGFSLLSPEGYLKLRLEDQLQYYGHRAAALDKKMRWLYRLIYFSGGLGTLLAAIGNGIELWVAATTSVAGAFTSYLGYMQVETNLMKYNHATVNLDNVRAWWTALSAQERSDPKNLDDLVGHTEMIMEGEISGWVKQMEKALADLKEQQEKEKPAVTTSQESAGQPQAPAPQ